MSLLCLDRHGLSKLLSGQRPAAAWETWLGSQEMFSTTRHAGFGLTKQNTAGWTAADSGALRLAQISCLDVSGQKEMGLTWRLQSLKYTTVASGLKARGS